MTIREDLRRLPAIVGVTLVGLAVVVLAIRVIALIAAVIADGVERAETTVADMAGTLPLGTRVILIPQRPDGAQ